MTESSKTIRGIKFTQETLNTDLQETVGGQCFWNRILVVIFSLGLAFLSGALVGSFGGFTTIQIVAPLAPETLLIVSSVILVVMIWATNTLRRSPADGLRALTISILAAFTLSAILLRQPDFSVLLPILLFALLVVIILTFSLLAGGLSFSLAFVLFKNNNRSFTKINAAILTVTAIIFAQLLAHSLVDSERTLFLSHSITYRVLPIVSGFILGSLTTAIALSVTQSGRDRNFTFLHDWAVAIGCWRGTSFYNLDLSHVNFRGAKLANTDLRGRKLYRTCFRDVTGLARARVDCRCLDLDRPKVQALLTDGYSKTKDFNRLNLRGAYLQGADMRGFGLIEADLTGADLRDADLGESLLVRTQVIGVDFTGANLTGICIEDWSVNSQTCFTRVQCDYVYRKLDERGNPCDRFPADRNFDPREFESLYQEVENVVELIFKEGENWQAALFSLKKLQLEDESLELELKGIERRGDLWVVKVTHNENYTKQEVEKRLNAAFDEMKHRLAAKEQQINQLLGIIADQAEALKGQSQRAFGNSFFIVGSTITNLAGSGTIDYTEAANQVRQILASGGTASPRTSAIEQLLHQLQDREVANTPQQQGELIQQTILAEADKDAIFRQFLLQQGEQIAAKMPETPIANAIRNAIAQLAQ
jgi:uncharacterized protein YjbI with pentapeptide repeats